MKTLRFFVVLAALTAFAVTGVAMAADMYYVVKDKSGNMKVVDKKPDDKDMIVKGPYKSEKKAKQILELQQSMKDEKKAK